MHGASNQERYTINYFYRDKHHTAEITEVYNVTGARYYWLKFKNKPPCYIMQDGDKWSMHGIVIEAELLEALIKGIKTHKRLP